MSDSKTMLIFGCTSGIGSEIMKLSQSYSIKVVSISKNSLRENYSNLLSFYQIDLSVTANITKIKKILKENNYKFDICIYNAGYAVAGNILELRPKDIIAMVNINFLMPLLIFKLVIAEKMLNKGAKMIYISTTAADKRIPEISIYSKTKRIFEEIIKCHADSFHRELNLKFIIVKLGRVNTNFGVNFPLSIRKEMKQGLSPTKVAIYILNTATGGIRDEIRKVTEIYLKK